MNPNDFAARMRAGERFHDLRLPAGEWPIIRVDGHGFSRFTQQHFDKPFDAAFHAGMTQTAQALLEEFDGLYAYTQSDEISLLLPRDCALFDRSLEKLVSLSASLAAATFTQLCGHQARFDSRIWTGSQKAQVVDYFRWRQGDATRCALNGWCYWTLRQSGMSAAQTTAMLQGQSAQPKRDLLLQHNINFDEVPLWQQRGAGVFWESYEKIGFDPVRQQAVTALRRRVKMDANLPEGEIYARFIATMLS